jgi:hypothetical protein
MKNAPAIPLNSPSSSLILRRVNWAIEIRRQKKGEVASFQTCPLPVIEKRLTQSAHTERPADGACGHSLRVLQPSYDGAIAPFKATGRAMERKQLSGVSFRGSRLKGLTNAGS